MDFTLHGKKFSTSADEVDQPSSRSPKKPRTIKVTIKAGLTNAIPFDLGGSAGNTVIATTHHSIRKGWRVIAVNGAPRGPSRVPSSIMAAHRGKSSFTVTFLDPFAVDTGAAGKPPPARPPPRSLTCEAEHESADKKRVAEEEAKANRAAAATEAKERKGELERRLAGEAATKVKEAAVAAAAERQAVARRAAEQRTAERLAAQERERPSVLMPAPGTPPTTAIKTTGALKKLPPKGAVGADAQRCLMQALATTSTAALLATPASAEAKGGPCSKCDGDHHADNCPHYSMKRSAHKDAWAQYRTDATDGGDDDDCAAPVVVTGKVLHAGLAGSAVNDSRARSCIVSTVNDSRARSYTVGHRL